MTSPTDARRIRVDAKKFAAAWNFVSTEATRYYLNGVHIEPHVNGGVLMVATNGHTLAAIYDPEGESSGRYICPVPLRMVRSARKRQRGATSTLDTPKHLHFIGNAAHLIGDHGSANYDPENIGPAHIETAYAPPIDGTFPDWRRVVPKFIESTWKPSPGGYLFTVNGDLVSKFSDSVRLIGRVKSAPLSFYLSEHGASGPIGVRSGDVPEFFGVLMPMRGDSAQHPHWLENKETAE